MPLKILCNYCWFFWSCNAITKEFQCVSEESWWTNCDSGGWDGLWSDVYYLTMWNGMWKCCERHKTRGNVVVMDGIKRDVDRDFIESLKEEDGMVTVVQWWDVWDLKKDMTARVSSKQSIFFSVRTETNRNSICFGCVSVCFAKPKNIFSVLFRFVSVGLLFVSVVSKHRNSLFRY
jgi:hypothetical protein